MGVSPDVAERVVTPGSAYWNQRHVLADKRARMEALSKAIGHEGEFSAYQWAQLTALTLEFQPDLILEIGRGWGSSTCAFADAANTLGADRCRVVSFDVRELSADEWRSPIAEIVSETWFDALQMVTDESGDFGLFDYESYLADAKRVLIFWDAPGYDVAECILGRILPQIADRPHLVTMHDISDAQFQGMEHARYEEKRLWKGGGSSERLRLGYIESGAEQAVAVVDFCSRNNLSLSSADASFQNEIAVEGTKFSELQELLGNELFSLQGNWFCFTLNERTDGFTFPYCPPPEMIADPAEEGGRKQVTLPIPSVKEDNQQYHDACDVWIPRPELQVVPDAQLSLPAAAVWNQRDKVAASRDRLLAIHDAIDHKSDLPGHQVCQLVSMALEYQPDLILELGRGAGNSTCAFTEAANLLGRDHCRVVSLCREQSWEKTRPAAIAKVVEEEWFRPLKTFSADILEFEYGPLLAGAERVLIFWDAHGFEVAECLLGKILPLVADRSHLVVMHDLSDTRFLGPQHWGYKGNRLWRGNDWSGPRVQLGHISSAVEQSVSIVDFCSRNNLPLHSAAESIGWGLASDEKRLEILRETLGEELFSPQAQWFWFSLNERPQPYTFPKFGPPEPEPEPAPDSEEPLCSPAASLWNQRHVLAESRELLLSLHDAVGRDSDMTAYQVTELAAMVLEYQPDLVMELGRGEGNSTCAFTEAANRLGPEKCRVVSLCRGKSWEREPPPKIANLVTEEWFKPLRTYSGNILDFDYEAQLQGAQRVLIFWDAHGYDVAETVLGRILPLLVDREHLVIMHDLTDARYLGPQNTEYGKNGLWRGNDWSGPRVRLGDIDSAVEQAVAIVDFSSRNKLTIHSADESIREEIGTDDEKLLELRYLLGGELFVPRAHWFWFSLNEKAGPFTFPTPRRRPPVLQQLAEASRKPGILLRLRLALRMLLKGRV